MRKIDGLRVARIRLAGGVWPRDEDSVHRRVLKRFPYTIHYELAERGGGCLCLGSPLYLAAREFALRTLSERLPYGAKPPKTVNAVDAMQTRPYVRMPAARPWYERS